MVFVAIDVSDTMLTYNVTPDRIVCSDPGVKVAKQKELSLRGTDLRTLWRSATASSATSVGAYALMSVMKRPLARGTRSVMSLSLTADGDSGKRERSEVRMAKPITP